MYVDLKNVSVKKCILELMKYKYIKYMSKIKVIIVILLYFLKVNNV